jgi:hypothetical protein
VVDLVLAAEEPLRPIDIAGLMGLIVVALAAIAWRRPLARGLMRFLRWPDSPSLEVVVRGGVVVLFAPNLVVAALCLLNVIELRPGQPGPGLFPKIWAVAGLAGLAVLMWRLVADAARRLTAR